MDFFITLYLALVCTSDGCKQSTMTITREAMAIATCESGNTVDFGTYSFTARSKTKDGGAWQFNDKTYKWLNGYTNAELDTPQNQYDTFVYLWAGGKGWRHWKASQPCWRQWLTIDDTGKSVWR